MVLIKRDNLLALFLIIGSISLRVAEAQSHKKGTRASRTRSLVHIFPPRDENPEAEFFAPTCTPSPPLPRRDGLGDEPADRHVPVPGLKGSTKPLSDIRAKPKVTKYREGSTPGIKKSKQKINASANDNISKVSDAVDLTINGDNVVGGGVDILPVVGEDSMIVEEVDDANRDEAGLKNDIGVESPNESKTELFGSSTHTSNNQTNAIDSTLASAQGLIFQYGQEDGSVTHIGGNGGNVSSSANADGPVTLYYDDTGYFYTAEETPHDATTPSHISFTPAAHGAMSGMESFAIAGNDVHETNGSGSDGLERRDESGGSSRGYAALCFTSLVVLL